MRLLLVSLILGLTFWGHTQGIDPSKPIPFDERVKIGKLDNGLTYFLRKNTYPEDKLELRLVVNAGSMQEDENQLGMAHFIEHMAFNGTTNFEKNDLIDFLQSIGLQFGADLNAYTSFDETVYILPIPAEHDSLIDKGLTVLKDWATGLTLDAEEVEKERGVVLEEWRLGQGAQQRMRDKYFPILFKGSRYADRLPIGTKESIENASYEDIKRFYEDWYRPELMAIVAVGDTDIEALEKKIIATFSDVQPKSKRRKKESNVVPPHQETLVAIAKDVENSFTAAQLIYKRPKESENTLADLRKNYLYSLYNAMLNSRLQELTQQAEPPFIFGASSFSALVRSTDTYASFAVSAPEQILGALKTLVIENERVKRHGFAPTELDRAVQNLQIQLENLTKEKDKTESRSYASEYVSYFLSGTPSPGIDYELSFFEQLIPELTVEEINALAADWITDENRVVILLGIDKEGVSLPSESEILDAINNIDTESITAYDDAVSDSPLIPDLPPAGRTIFTKKIDTVGVTELRLSNGMKVVVKSTDFKNDQILMAATSDGGHSLYSDEDFRSASMSAGIIDQSGIGAFSLIELRKLLSGKNVEVSPFVSGLKEGFNGSSTPEDFETMLQLVHLYFTAPRMDTAAFQSMISRSKDIYENLLVSPQYYFNDQVSRVMSQNHPRGGGFPTPEELDQVSMGRAFDIYAERFANAGDFTFFLVGNIDLPTMKPMVEKYLGSLPGSRTKESWKDPGIRIPSGTLKKDFFKGTDEKSAVIITFTGFEYLEKERSYHFGVLGDILENRLIDILRENESGVYTVNVGKSTTDVPYERFSFSIRFPCSPENVEKLTQLTYEEIRKIQAEGVTAEDLQKIREADLQNRKENLRENGYWLRSLRNYYEKGKDLKTFYEYEGLVRSVTSEDIQAVASDYIDTTKPIQLVLYPEGYENR